MYFSIFNQHFYYHPHKVIFCASRFRKEAQVWWELCARGLGRDAQGFQLYPAYEQFVEEVRRRFWKDANAEIKLAQWEGLRQSNFPDGDLFFQQFESLAFEAGVLGIDPMMVAQVKKACRATTKDIIYASDADPPAGYQAWKKQILRIDHNWRTRKAEQRGGKVTEWKQQAKANTMPTATKGNQPQTRCPRENDGNCTTYGGAGKPMDIDAVRAKTKCFGCGQHGHFKRDCPQASENQGGTSTTRQLLLGPCSNERNNGRQGGGGKRRSRAVNDSTDSAKDLVSSGTHVSPAGQAYVLL